MALDYRGNDVSARNFLNILSGRHPPGTPASGRLRSDNHSDVLVYMTGHGGDEFLKFRDFEEMTAVDLAIAVGEMHTAGRYSRLMVLADTCEAASLSAYFTPEDTPELGFFSSSLRTENSYSLASDFQLGVLVSDRWTHYIDQHLDKAAREQGGRPLSFAALMDRVGRERLNSNIGRMSTMSTPMTEVAARCAATRLSRAGSGDLTPASVCVCATGTFWSRASRRCSCPAPCRRPHPSQARH